MERIFSPDYAVYWAIALALALFLPVRTLIHVLMVRRAKRRSAEIDDKEIARLKTRAGVTAALLCFVFAFFYANHFFRV